MSSTTGFGAGQRQKGQHDSVHDQCRKQHHRLRVSQGDPGKRRGTETFTNQEELTALADKWPGGRLVEVWNSLPGVQPVERFTSRRVAVGRIWKAIQHLKPTGAGQSH